MQIRGQFDKFFGTTMLPMLMEKIRDGYQEEPSIGSGIFQERTMTGSIKSVAGRSGYSLAAEITAEGGEIRTDHRVQAFSKQWVPRKFGLGREVTREMVEDDQFDVIGDDAMEIGRSIRETCEIARASVFNNGFTSTTGSPDGVALFSASHPMVKYGGVQSNILSVAADLDQTSLELALIDYNLMRRSNGHHMSNPTPRLLVSAYNVFNSHEIVKSELRSDTANNATNAIRGRGAVSDILVWKYLTDADAWFLIAPAARTGLRWYWRKKPYQVRDSDPRTEREFLGMAYREDHGWEDYLGLYGTAGA